MNFNATFIVVALNFIIFSIIMNAIFYKPLAKIVEERQKFIEDTNEEAKTKAKKSEDILKDKERKLEKIKHDAKKIILEKSEEVKAKKVELSTEATQKATQKVESAKVELNKSKDEAENILSIETQKLAQEISSKILGKV